MFTIAGARRQLELEREGKPCYANADVVADDGRAEELEAENARLRDEVEELSARVDEQVDSQPDMWEDRLASQSQQIEALEVELAESKETVQTLQVELADSRETIESLEVELTASKETVESLEVELAEANQTIAGLEDKLAEKSRGGLDPRIVRGLREQLQGLARAAQRPV
jgi:septal ring factor EnvC (AmiA/AmiB activator)